MATSHLAFAASELHGAALDSRELLDVCRFVASINFAAVTILTDTAMTTPAVI